MLNKNIKYLPILSLILSLLLLFSIVFPTFSSEGENVMNGIQATFGGNVGSVGDFASAEVNFSILNFIAFFLPAIIALIFTIYRLRNPKNKTPNNILNWVLSVVFIVSVFFIAYLPKHTTMTFTLFGNQITGDYVGANLAIGGVLALVFAILGAISAIVFGVLQLRKD
mgnify:CR=1 FL=1